MSCGVGHGRGSDLVLLWLWCRPAATALSPALAWEPPYATGSALKRHTHTHTHIEKGGVLTVVQRVKNPPGVSAEA